MLVYFMTIWNIKQPFGIIYGRLVKYVVIWYIFPQFGMFGARKNLATLGSDGAKGWQEQESNQNRIVGVSASAKAAIDINHVSRTCQDNRQKHVVTQRLHIAHSTARSRGNDPCTLALGCQIFLGTRYQNEIKCTKMTTIYTKWP
jgi:hypothetical protein